MMSRCRVILPMLPLFVRSLSQALRVPSGIDGDDRAGGVLQMGNASHYREGHLTIATLPTAASIFGVILFFLDRAAPTGDLREKRVEPIGCFVLDPMPRSRNNLEPSIWLDIVQCAGAIIEMGVGSRIALTPNPVDARLDER